MSSKVAITPFPFGGGICGHETVDSVLKGNCPGTAHTFFDYWKAAAFVKAATDVFHERAIDAFSNSIALHIVILQGKLKIIE